MHGITFIMRHGITGGILFLRAIVFLVISLRYTSSTKERIPAAKLTPKTANLVFSKTP